MVSETSEDYDGIFLSNGPGDPGNKVFSELKGELKNVIFPESPPREKDVLRITGK